MVSDSSSIQSRLSRFSVVSKYLKSFRYHIVGGTIAVIIANALVLVAPYIIKGIFELLERGAPSGELIPQITPLIAIAIGSGVLGFAAKRLFLSMGRRVEYGLRHDLMAHVVSLSPSFYRKTHTGDIMSRMTSDIDTIRTMLGEGTLHAAETVVTILIALPMMIYLSPKLTLLGLGPVVILPLLINKLGNAIHTNYIPIQRQNAEMTSAVQENLAGSRVVRAYRQEESQIAEFTARSLKYVKLNMNLARLLGAFFPLTMFVASCLSLSVFYFGGIEVIRGTIPLGTLVAFFVYLGILFWPMYALGGLISIYQRGTVSLDRINDILSVQPEAVPGLGQRSSRRANGRIEFKDTRFGYNDNLVLDGINLTIESGQHVGIVGRTGAGKTTLVSLLPRLFPVDNGQVFIDGIDINKWEPGELRHQIGFAAQEAFLFSDTIEGNIRLGSSESDRDSVIRAADMTTLTDDIRALEFGFETVVGERGIMLSGGQKQRTSIARAVIHDPAILILDDITSAVDAETEAKILSRLKACMTGRTTISISQRISTVRYADLVVCMERGRIVEQGTHRHLIEINGYYAKMRRLQRLSEELDRS